MFHHLSSVLFLRIHPSPTAGSGASSNHGKGKPSLRRIKGRVHRSKSLDSIDLLDSNLFAESVRREAYCGGLIQVDLSERDDPKDPARAGLFVAPVLVTFKRAWWWWWWLFPDDPFRT
uniref:Uncharacterized protein n=1 Tax=Knipowitschia caucasica TaxID=637954 RepID=A0AAV2L5G0_KNICA